MKPMPTEAQWFRRWMGEVAVALAFLTRLPVGARMTKPSLPLAEAMRAFPVVGAFLGAGGGMVLWLATIVGAPPLVAAVAALACLILLTGGFHEDGFADMVDGFGGGSDRESTLAIMRDSHIGTFGVVALVLALTAKAASFADMATNAWYVAPAVLASTGAFSRALVVWLMGTTRPARIDGLSVSAGQPAPNTMRGALIIGGVGSAILLLTAGGASMTMLVLIVGALTAAFLRAAAMRRVGGQTGDICGGLQVLTETTMLATAATMLA